MNKLFHPGLLVAIALHAILLWFPLSSNSKSEASKAEEAQSETALKTEGETVSDKPTDTAELSPSIPDIPLKSSQKSAPRTLKPSGTLTTASSKPPKTNVAKVPVKSAATQTTAARPPQKPTNASRTTVPIPKTVPTFTASPAVLTSKATPQPSPAASPSPAALPSPAVSPTPASQPHPAPTPLPLSPAVSPTPQTIAIIPATISPAISTDPFTKVPFYPLERSLMGSLDLQPPEREREIYAFNTRETTKDAIAFYEKELPKELFEPLKLEKEEKDLIIYEVKPKNGGKSRYLHFIPFQGRTVILLLPEKMSNLEAIKTGAIERQKERRKFLGLFSQMERIRQQIRASQFSL